MLLNLFIIKGVYCSIFFVVSTLFSNVVNLILEKITEGVRFFLILGLHPRADAGFFFGERGCERLIYIQKFIFYL